MLSLFFFIYSLCFSFRLFKFSLVTNTDYYIQHDLHWDEFQGWNTSKEGKRVDELSAGMDFDFSPPFFHFLLPFNFFFDWSKFLTSLLNNRNFPFSAVLSCFLFSFTPFYVEANRCFCFFTKSRAILSPTLVSRIWRIGWSGNIKVIQSMILYDNINN